MPVRPTFGLLFAALSAVAVLAFCETGAAQRKKRLPRWKIDPYTKNDPAALKKAGYVRYGPFPFGEFGSKLIDTAYVDKHLSYAKIRWVETAHFRIGTTLPSWPVPADLWTRKKIRAELTRLKVKIPKVNPRTRSLDPWLRLHLTAQRMEEHYAEMQDWLGVQDADFPKNTKARKYGETYMGEGKYLGMPSKYMLLVTDKGNTYLDYLRNFTGLQSKFGQRWHFMKEHALFYGIGTDLGKGSLRNDTALHGHLVFNMTINLLDGFRHYSYDLPVWIREGLAHWFERRVSPKYNSFDQDEAAPLEPMNRWRWEPYVRQMLPVQKKWSPYARMLQWRQYGDISLNDHVMVWARVDFLMSFGKAKFKKLMFEIKGRYDHKTGKSLHSDIVGVTRDAVTKFYGFNPLKFDAKFAEWVKENYSLK